MDIDGLDSAKWKNLEEGTHWELFELLSEIRQKMNSSSSPFKDINGQWLGRL